MIWENPASRTASNFAGNDPANEIVSMPNSVMFGSGAPSRSDDASAALIVHELEHHTTEVALRQCTARFRMDALRFDEGHSALAECRNRLQYIRRPETDALQHL